MSFKMYGNFKFEQVFVEKSENDGTAFSVKFGKAFSIKFVLEA